MLLYSWQTGELARLVRAGAEAGGRARPERPIRHAQT